MLSTTDGPLPGGNANRGRVIRVGDEVHRPCGSHSEAVHRFLRHLARSGFSGAPRVTRVDDGSTEVLAYVPGDVATDPLPEWALTDEALASVGVLLRDFHAAGAGFDTTGLTWQRTVPAPWRGPLVTHNDVNPTNVVFRDGRAVCLIDFDLASPGSPAWELAGAACLWAPLRSESDVQDSRQGQAVSRFAALLSAYEAPRALRHEVVDACAAFNDWIAYIMRDESRRGHPAFEQVWAQYSDVLTRAGDWIRRNRSRLLDAVD